MTTCLLMRRVNIEDAPRPFSITLEQRGDTIVVAVTGEVDLSCSEELRSQLLELCASPRRLVLDLRTVQFMDSSGLHCVLEVDAACRAAATEFLLVRGPRQVQRLFEVTRTAERLRFVDWSAERHRLRGRRRRVRQVDHAERVEESGEPGEERDQEGDL